MYENSQKTDCKKNPRRTPSNSKRSRPIEIMLWKETRDEDLFKGLEVCYQDLGGAFTKLGHITDTIVQDGVKTYLMDTAMGAYQAEELKLIKQP